MLVLLVFIPVLFTLYYINLVEISHRQNISYMRSITDQVETRIISSINDLKTASTKIAYSTVCNSLIKEGRIAARLELTQSLRIICDSIFAMNPGISALSIEDMHNRLFTYTQVSVSTWHIMNNYSYNITDGWEISGLRRDAGGSSYFALIMPIQEITGESGIRTIGQSTILCSMYHLNMIFHDIELPGGALIILYDQYGNILTLNNANPDYIIEAADNNSFEKWEEEIDGMQWKLVSILPRARGLNDSQLNIMITLLVSMGFIVIILLVIWMQLNHSVFRPVAQISHFLQSPDSRSPLSKTIELESNDEIGALAKYINDSIQEAKEMTASILDTQSKLYETEILRKQAELSALQNQINPHFLYNTLECVRSIAVIENNSEIETIAMRLAGIFRYSIKGGNIVKLSDDIYIVQNYIDIMNIRFMNKFHFAIDLDDDMYEWHIPKMILQPLVENAIFHGLETRRGKGNIIISGEYRDECLVLTVSDDGNGIEKEQLEKIRRSLVEVSTTDERGLGLINLNRRIEMEYSITNALSVDSNPEKGTVVTLRIPYKQ